MLTAEGLSEQLLKKVVAVAAKTCLGRWAGV
jgi:hypothetical protein